MNLLADGRSHSHVPKILPHPTHPVKTLLEDLAPLLPQLAVDDAADVMWLAQYPDFRYCVIGRDYKRGGHSKHPNEPKWTETLYTLPQAVARWVNEYDRVGLGIFPPYGNLMIVDVDELGMTAARKRLASFRMDDGSPLMAPLVYHSAQAYIKANDTQVDDLRAKYLIILDDPTIQPFSRKQTGVEYMWFYKKAKDGQPADDDGWALNVKGERIPASMAALCGSVHPDSGVKYSIRVKCDIPVMSPAEWLRFGETLTPNPKLLVTKEERAVIARTSKTVSVVNLPDTLIPPSDYFIQHDHHLVERLARRADCVELARELGYEVRQDQQANATHRVMGQSGCLIDKRTNTFSVQGIELGDRVFGGGPIQLLQYLHPELRHEDHVWKLDRSLYESLIWFLAECGDTPVELIQKRRDIERVVRRYGVEHAPYVRIEDECYEQDVVHIAPTGSGKTTAYVQLARRYHKPDRFSKCDASKVLKRYSHTTFQVVIVVPSYPQSMTLYRDWQRDPLGHGLRFGVVNQDYHYDTADEGEVQPKGAKGSDVIFTTYNSFDKIKPSARTIVLVDEVHRIQTDESFRPEAIDMALAHCDKVRQEGGIVHYATATLNDLIPFKASKVVVHDIPKVKPKVKLTLLTEGKYDAWLFDELVVNAGNDTLSVVLYNSHTKLNSYAKQCERLGLSSQIISKKTKGTVIDTTVNVLLCTSIMYDGHSLKTIYGNVRYYAPDKHKPAPCEFIQLINRIREREETTIAYVNFNSIQTYRWRLDTLTEATRIYTQASERSHNRATQVRTELAALLSEGDFDYSANQSESERYYKSIIKDVSFIGDFRRDPFSMYKWAVGRCSSTYQLELLKFGYQSVVIEIATTKTLVLETDEVEDEFRTLLADVVLRGVRLMGHGAYTGIPIYANSDETVLSLFTREVVESDEELSERLLESYETKQGKQAVRLIEPLERVCSLAMRLMDTCWNGDLMEYALTQLPNPFTGTWRNRVWKLFVDHARVNLPYDPRAFVYHYLKLRVSELGEDEELMIDQQLWEDIKRVVRSAVKVPKSAKRFYMSHYENRHPNCKCTDFTTCTHKAIFNESKWRRDVNNTYIVTGRRKSKEDRNVRVNYLKSFVPSDVIDYELRRTNRGTYRLDAPSEEF